METLRPPVSVIIATRNRCGLLGQTLNAIAGQEWPRDRAEVIVADNGSTDDTASTVAAAAKQHRPLAIRYLSVDQPGKSNAVNAALKVATGDPLVFTDDDVQPARGWLRSIVAAFEQTSADFLAGRILPNWESPPPSWMSPALHGVLAIPDNGEHRLDIVLGGNEMVIPIGANMAVRRAVIERVGGLRDDLGKLEGSLRTGEDHEFFLRMIHAGFRGIYEPTAVVYHRVPAERLKRSYFRRWLFQNGRDVARLRAAYRPGVPHLAGIPRYLWRQAISDAIGAIVARLKGKRDTSFGLTTRVVWFAGYLRQSWTGGGQHDARV